MLASQHEDRTPILMLVIGTLCERRRFRCPRKRLALMVGGDELARQQQQEENRENPVALEKVEEQAPMSRVEVGIAILVCLFLL